MWANFVRFFFYRQFLILTVSSFLENAERNSRLSSLEELTEDLLEDCGPPRRAPTPASSSSELPTGSTVQQESHTVEEPKPSEKLRSPVHQSPKS